jgi:hypothetical protein
MGPGRRGGLRAPRDTVDLSGTIENYNFSPRGDVDGLILKTGDKTAQVNLPPGVGLLVSQQVTAGSQVKVRAFALPGGSAHSVYVFVSLSGESGKEIKIPSPQDRRFVHEEGTVKNLNYSRNGEVDGVVLNGGDFVHLGPAAGDLKLSIGRKLTVDGFALSALGSDHQAIAAVAVDGKAVEPAAPPRADGPPGPGPRDPRGGPDAPGMGRPGQTQSPPQPDRGPEPRTPPQADPSQN